MTTPQKSPLTHTEVTGRAEPVCERIFHASLPLHILLERRPRPDNPNWVDIGCWRHGNIDGMMVYLSPIDAMIDMYDRNKNGGKFEISPFVSIDPREFIQEHDGWFTVCLVYGFAARANRLVQSEQGHLMPLVSITHFRISDQMSEHFHLEFGNKTHAWLERLHCSAGIPDYVRVHQDLNMASFFELTKLTSAALERVDSPDRGRENITHAGLYDAVEQTWRFVALSDLRPPSDHRPS